MMRSLAKPCCRILFYSLAVCFALAANAESFQNPERKQVLATIKPLQLLVKAIGGERIDVEVLLAPQQSPHHYQLRPSDRRKLAQAEQIYWIGPDMETFLARTALAMPAPQWQTLGKTLAASAGHDHDHDYDAADSDPHLWLGYEQIVLMSAQIEDGLSRLSPPDSAHFAANRAQFLAQLAQLDRRAAADLSAYSQRGFIMSHAAYSRLLAHYGLAGGMSLSDAHGQVAGAKRWQQLEQYMAEQSPQCFLRDPFERQPVEATFLQRYPLTVVAADTMGVDIAPTANGFIEFYRGLTASVTDCLKIEPGRQESVKK